MIAVLGICLFIASIMIAINARDIKNLQKSELYLRDKVTELDTLISILNGK